MRSGRVAPACAVRVLYCDQSTVHTYMRQRGAARDTPKLANWGAYLASVDLELRPPVPHHLLDNSISSTPLQEQAEALVRELTGTP
jgi:hypothetical protein